MAIGTPGIQAIWYVYITNKYVKIDSIHVFLNGPMRSQLVSRKNVAAGLGPISVSEILLCSDKFSEQ